MEDHPQLLRAIIESHNQKIEKMEHKKDETFVMEAIEKARPKPALNQKEMRNTTREK